MRTTISPGFAAALFFSTAFAASQQPETKPSSGPAVVSVDLLRHPISANVRKRLLSALNRMESGDHEGAIAQLQETLSKYPDSAPYVHNLLGVEYVKTDRVEAAVSSFEQAVSLLPHDAMTHYNFGLALICAGDYDRAAQEVQRALELDPGNAQMQARLDTIKAALRDHSGSNALPVSRSATTPSKPPDPR
jgi:Tfp pilus assembly protein PilF